MKAIGYVRVSTVGQASDGVSLDAQREKIQQYAQLYDVELVEIIEDPGASAKSLDRPGLHDVLSRLQSGEADTLIVVKLDRLTRSVADLALLIEQYFQTFQLISVGEQINTSSAAGRLVLNVLMSVSQWEREAISERTSAALQHKKAQGLRVGSIPYGYELGPDGKSLIENDAEQEIVKYVKELRDAGLSLRKIAQKLEEYGFRNRCNRSFQAQTIANILLAS